MGIQQLFSDSQLIVNITGYSLLPPFLPPPSNELSLGQILCFYQSWNKILKVECKFDEVLPCWIKSGHSRLCFHVLGLVICQELPISFTRPSNWHSLSAWLRSLLMKVSTSLVFEASHIQPKVYLFLGKFKYYLPVHNLLFLSI